MSHFIQNIAQIVDAGLPIDANTDLEILDRHFKDAETSFVKPVLGADLWNVLLNGEGEGDEERIDSLLAYIRVPVVFNGYYRFSKIPGGLLNHRGFYRDSTQYSEHAPKWEKDELKASLICKADYGLDELIKYLQDNREVYPEWRESDFFQKNIGLIIPIPEIFGRYIPNLNCSGRVFHNLLQYRLRAERMLIKVICKPLYERVKNELRDIPEQEGGESQGLSPEIEELLEYLRPLVAYNTMAMGIKAMNFHYTEFGIYTYSYSDGTFSKKPLTMAESSALAEQWRFDYEEARTELIAFLRDNINDYPEYKNSDCFGQKGSFIISRYTNAIENKHVGL